MTGDNEQSSDPKVVAVHWLARQEFNNVMLAALVVLGAGTGFYGTPWIIKEMKAGYKEVADELSKSMAEEREANKSQRELDRAMHKENVERLERILRVQVGKSGSFGTSTGGTNDGN